MNAGKLINYSKNMSTVGYVTYYQANRTAKDLFGSSQAALTIN